MLREVKHPHLGLRIAPYIITYTGGVPSMDLGIGSYLPITDTGVGRAVITQRRPFYGNDQMVFLSRNQNALGTSNGFCAIDDTTAQTNNNTAELNAFNASGVFEDCGWDGFSVGYSNPEFAAITRPMMVKCELNAPLILGAQINGTAGTVTIGKNDISLVKNATGDYTITFLRKFGHRPMTKFSVINGSFAQEMIVLKPDRNSVNVQFRNAATGANADATFNMIAMGTRGQEKSSKAFANLEGTQRKPRILVFKINFSATPALLFGGADGAVVDTGGGVGDARITFTTAFAREPIVVVTGGFVTAAKPETQLVTVTSSTVRIQCANSAETLIDGEHASVFVLGSDDPSEY